MAEARELTLAELLRRLQSSGPYAEVLYERMLDYPLRDAKALRPALCIASCRALGGSLEGVLKSAAVLEAVSQHLPRPRRHRRRLGASAQRPHAAPRQR